MNRELMFSRKSDEWATPQDFFDRLDAEFDFTLDPCATEENHKTPAYYTAADDGLQKNWGGAASILQSTVLQDISVGTEVLRRITQTRNRGCASYSVKNGYKIFSRLHHTQERDPVR